MLQEIEIRLLLEKVLAAPVGMLGMIDVPSLAPFLKKIAAGPVGMLEMSGVPRIM
jgi:hypothetical protein